MEPLASLRCEACRRGAPTVTDEQKAELLPQIPAWRLVEEDRVERLERNFEFPDFALALEFTNRIGMLAEEQGHHPALLTEWGRVRVHWWTHSVRGLHRNDFIMAAKTDQVYSDTGNPRG